MAVDEQLVDALRPIMAAAGGIRAAYLFGSQATGGARADSDVDIAVLYDGRLSAAGRERARRALVGELGDVLGPSGEGADVIDLERAGSALAFRVISDGIRLYATDEATRVRLEARVARRYDDEAPRRRLIRQAAARAGQRMERATHGRQ
jgi:predicted nucleotidyltransferase